MYTVFKITGTDSKQIYIGFCETDAQDPLAHFLAGATRSEEDRADVRFVAEHGGTENLSFETVETELEDLALAVAVRNNYRATERNVFTGPTSWPLLAYKQACERDPEYTANAFAVWQARHLPTARQAYETGKLWSFDQIKSLSATHGRELIKNDMSTMTPADFADKYDLG